jgi:hypothetical protein
MFEPESDSSSPKNELDEVVVTLGLAVVTRWAVPGWVERATAAKPASAAAAVMPIA